MRDRGVTLVELLVALAVFSVVMALIGFFMGQQSRVVSLSQSINEAEITARSVAEAVAQEFQLAGSRAVQVGDAVNYVDIEAGGCDGTNRDTCVFPVRVGSDGTISPPSVPADINGYAIRYRTSLDGAAPYCRRVDFAFVGTSLYRSDVDCAAGITAIDLDAALYATNVTSFAVDFECSDSTVDPGPDPAACYGVSDAFVRQASVTVGVQVGGRTPTAAEMSFVALTANLRPSVSYSDPD
jgi:prepilin-type N-terminal cleavage/methylation domain-containing protein